MNCSQNQPDPSVDSSLSRNDVENLAMKEGWTWIPPLDLPDHILQMSLLERAAWFEEYLLANEKGMARGLAALEPESTNQLDG